MQLELKQITVPPGNQLLLKDITWQMFEALLSELGESRASRLSYSKGTLEIMVPLPEHEVGKVLIANLADRSHPEKRDRAFRTYLQVRRGFKTPGS
jgi:Uma2 family endonuclease